MTEAFLREYGLTDASAELASLRRRLVAAEGLAELLARAAWWMGEEKKVADKYGPGLDNPLIDEARAALAQWEAAKS